MKVLFIHNSLAEYRIEFMRALSRLCNVHYLITDQSEAQKIYGLQLPELDDMNITFLKSRKEKKEIAAYIVKDKPDLVVAPPLDDFYQLQCAWIAVKTAHKHGIKLAYWTEKWEYEWRLQPFRKKIKNLIHRMAIHSITRHCAVCIAAGSKIAEYFRTIGVKEENIRICYNSSVSPSCENLDIHKQYSIPKNNKIILFLGRIVPRKGCIILIEAFDKLLSNHDDITLLIVGDGDDMENCKNKVRQLKIDENVIFTGKVQPNKRAAFYLGADVSVLPSYALGGVIEAWGLTVNESLEQGTPVVSTNVVCSAHDLLDGECGIMVQENNVEELSEAIEKIIYAPNKEAQRKACLQKYEEFSVPNMARRFYDAFVFATGKEYN